MRIPSLALAAFLFFLSPTNTVQAGYVAGGFNGTVPTCRTITSWSDLTLALDVITIASQAARADYQTYIEYGTGAAAVPPVPPPQPPVLILCPFQIIHDGTDNDGYDITAPDLTIVCNHNGPADRSVTGADCTISGTARHFNVLAHNVNFGGVNFKGSENGAVVVGGGVQGTTFVGSEFLENSRNDANGGAVSLQLGSSGTFFSHCLFSDNLALNGGAISGAFATANLYSSTLYFNEAGGNGGGVHMQGGQPYIFSVSGSRFLYNSASYGHGPALWSDGVPCDAGGNYACNNVDWTNNVPCDGILTARDGVCEVFDDNCHIDTNDADALGRADADNLSSDKVIEPSASPSGMPSVSYAPTAHPSGMPSSSPTASPTAVPSEQPSNSPTVQHSDVPSTSPSSSPSSGPTDSPSETPTSTPSSSPSAHPTAIHSGSPSSVPSASPTVSHSDVPSSTPTVSPTKVHSSSPSAAPSANPSSSPTVSFAPSPSPSASPSSSPTSPPTSKPSASPSASPTISHAPTRGCHVNEVERARLVSDMIIEETATTFDDILNDSSPQYMAFHWLLYEDHMYLCPDDDGIVQRYVMAVFYFSTHGDGWEHCGADESSSDCSDGNTRFLSATSECKWFGITCGGTGTITKIALENNNLDGPIPNELSALTDLVTLSLEKMSLSGTIPSSLGSLTKLLSLDLDYNQITGTIPPELSAIHELKLLDLNDNLLSGSVDALAGLHHLLFAQMHHNMLSGTISEGLGELKELRAITLFGNNLKGTVPEGMCENKIEKGGPLQHLEVDCGGDNADLTCSCCSQCWTETPTTSPTPAPSESPSAAPTPVHSHAPSVSLAPTVQCNMDAIARSFFLQAVLRDVSDPVEMVTEGSAQSKAFTWLIEEDPMYVCPTDANVIQRYVLALFYFSTEGDSWFSCTKNYTTPCGRGVDTARWLSNYDECNWSGVDCDESGIVSGIVFDDNGLGGSIPSEISNLASLEMLKLENGNIAGTLPSTLGSLQLLRELDLDFNELTGSIPGELADAKELRVLDLNNNFALTGDINALSHLINLKFVQLHHTQISGTIPNDFGYLKQLETLSLYATDLEGTMPRSVCRNRSTLSGNLVYLQADCGGSSPEVLCICCSTCFPLRRLSLDTAAVALMPTNMPVVPPQP